jgi:hypothetical protein
MIRFSQMNTDIILSSHVKQLPALGVTYMPLPTVRCKFSSLSLQLFNSTSYIKNKFLLVLLVCIAVYSYIYTSIKYSLQ